MVRTATSTKSDLEFHYDAMGNRVCKIVKPRDGSAILTQDEWTYTYYVRDASGNVISVYDRNYDHPDSKFYDQFTLEESHLYGSSRVGIKSDTTTIASKQYSFVAFNGDGTFDTSSPLALSTVAASTTTFTHEMRRKSYELSNHLGNVLVTVSDARTATNNSGTVVAFSAVVISASDYYAFGSSMVGRTISGDYRYTFNGKETDSETDLQDYGMRIYNPRIGRFLSVDPITRNYPMHAPYQFAANCPISLIDKNGESPAPPDVWALFTGDVGMMGLILLFRQDLTDWIAGPYGSNALRTAADVAPSLSILAGAFGGALIGGGIFAAPIFAGVLIGTATTILTLKCISLVHQHNVNRRAKLLGVSVAEINARIQQNIQVINSNNERLSSIPAEIASLEHDVSSLTYWVNYYTSQMDATADQLANMQPRLTELQQKENRTPQEEVELSRLEDEKRYYEEDLIKAGNAVAEAQLKLDNAKSEIEQLRTLEIELPLENSKASTTNVMLQRMKDQVLNGNNSHANENSGDGL